jgi:glycosyltransferase involved in cell wall biosynthesis
MANYLEDYFGDLQEANDGTLVFDSIFLNRLGGIGRDSQYIYAELSKYKLPLMEYKNQCGNEAERTFLGPSTFSLHLASLLNLNIPKPPVPAGMSIWFSQFTSWDIRDRNIRDFIRVHDLFPLTNPEWFPLKQNLLFKRNIKHINAKTHFVANSSYTADCLLKRLQIKSNQIDVLPCKVELLSTIRCENCDGCNLELTDGFALSVGTIEPRKNYGFLIQNWMRKEVALKLVIVGRNGWKSAKVLKILDENKTKIIWIKRACDGSLQSLYKNCEYFISASLDEGFDLPTSEANLYGCKLILSDIPVHRKMYSNNTNLFSRNSGDQLRSLL